MPPGCYRFDRFLLDPGDRRLTRDGAPVDLNARYLDALALLVGEHGKLVAKDRFLDQVWRGVPVTDEALTQCIRTIRRQLGDDAANPRFIETVPKHGYRFIAPVTHEPAPEPTAAPLPAIPTSDRWQRFFLLGGGGMTGGGVAGVFGGLLYGLAGAGRSLEPGMGATSVVMVLVAVTVLVGLAGGAGVGFGIAATGLLPPRPRPSGPGRTLLLSVCGGALGGLIVGGMAKLIGLDAFNLLLGQSPGEITGAGEGALLGGAIGLGTWLGRRGTRVPTLGRSMAWAGLTGGVAGVVISLLGGRLLGGSLDLLARRFPTSRLDLDPVGALFGEAGFGPLSQTVTAGLEGTLFGSFVVGAMLLVQAGRSGTQHPA